MNTGHHSLSAPEVFAHPGALIATETITVTSDIAAHEHDFAEIALVTEGSGEHHVAAGTYAVSPGTLLLLAPGSWHAYRALPSLRLTNIYLSAGLISTLSLAPESAAAMRPLIHHVTVPGSVAAFQLRSPNVDQLSALLAPIAAAAHPTPLTQLGTAYLLLNYLVEHCETAAPIAVSPFTESGGDPSEPAQHTTLSPHSERTTVAVSLLHSRLSASWRLAELAAALNTSASQLVRAFRADLGVGPMTYLQQLRADRMAYLLRTTDLTVAAAGRTVGWDDPSYASRRFAARWGTSPTGYRRLTPGSTVDHKTTSTLA